MDKTPRIESFPFFENYLKTWALIPDPTLRLEFYEGLLNYAFYWIQSNNQMVQALLHQTMFAIDKSIVLKNNKSEKMKGNKNAEKNWGKASKQSQTEINREKQEVEIEIKEKQKKEKSEDAFATLTGDKTFKQFSPEVQKAYLDFLENRKAMWIKNTSQALSRHLAFIQKIGNQKLQLATINKAIGANWRGLFALSETEQKQVLAQPPPPKKQNEEPDFSWVCEDITWKT